MTLFTKKPLERLMMQRPYPGKEETPRTTAPEGHFCYGCSCYGTVCLRPCYRDTDLREKAALSRYSTNAPVPRAYRDTDLREKAVRKKPELSL